MPLRFPSVIGVLALAVSASAADFVGNQTFNPGYVAGESVSVVGDVTLSGPGSYNATSWSIVGTLRLAQPGVYTFVATSTSTGTINVSGQLVGPSPGSATLNVIALTFNFAGTAPGNVTVSRTPPRFSPGAEAIPPPQFGVAAAAPLINISTRVTLAAGQTVTPGFVVGGTAQRRVLVRAIGPGLAGLGVGNPLANPTLTLFRGSASIAANDDWSSDLTAIFAATGAFALPAGSSDAALLATLAPGNYTVQVRSAVATGAGEVVVEVYFVD